MPLSLFRDRNFSLSNAAITTVGFAITAMAFPFMLFTQAVLGYSPTKSALLLVPMAVLFSVRWRRSWAGSSTRSHPRYITTGGMLLCSISLFWVSRVMTPDVAVWQLLLPMALLGVANAGMWAPLAATATRNLPPRSAGAGAGIYNTTRQVGAVLGSAAIAAVIEARLTANLGAAGGAPRRVPARQPARAGGGALPPQVASGFASAMSEAMLLPLGGPAARRRGRAVLRAAQLRRRARRRPAQPIERPPLSRRPRSRPRLPRRPTPRRGSRRPDRRPATDCVRTTRSGPQRPHGHRGGRGDVERVDATGHRDADGEVRALEGPPAQPVALGAEDQRQPLRRVGGQLRRG